MEVLVWSAHKFQRVAAVPMAAFPISMVSKATLWAFRYCILWNVNVLKVPAEGKSSYKASPVPAARKPPKLLPQPPSCTLWSPSPGEPLVRRCGLRSNNGICSWLHACCRAGLSLCTAPCSQGKLQLAPSSVLWSQHRHKGFVQVKLLPQKEVCTLVKPQYEWPL